MECIVEDVRLEGIKKEYSRSDSITFGIINNKRDTIYYYTTMEVLYDTIWREIPIIDDKHTMKTHRCTPIKANSNVCDVIKIDDSYDLGSRYRIVINYALPNQTNFKKIYSDIFIINDTK